MASLKSCGVKIFVSSCLTLEKSAKLGRVGSGGVVGTVRGIASNTLTNSSKPKENIGLGNEKYMSIKKT